jgi:putative hemolysin
MRIQWIIAALFLTAAYMVVPALADAGTCSQDQGMLIGMPDPSAVWAEQMGYGYATRVDDQGGQYGVIILPDGTERDAWEAYREYLAAQDEPYHQDGPMIGMPNPSAVWADEMGYQYETRVDDQGGQYGVIILPDGTERDAWEAYREYLAQQDESGQQSVTMIGMPNPSAVWADEMGYQYVTQVDDQGGQYGVIILPDGTERDAWEAYREYLAQQDDEAGAVNQGDPVIGVPGQTGYLDLIQSQGFLYRHDLFTYRDGTGRDSWSAFHENGALSLVHTGTAAANLLGGGQTSRQSLIASLLEKSG